MVRQKILVSGHIAWANAELHSILGPYADIVHLEASSRAEFLEKFLPANPNIVGIYRHNSSADKIGVYDKALIDALPDTVKYIAHNGAGYDQIDVAACKARGIHVANTPAAVDSATATTALFLMISVFRQYSIAERSARAGTWKKGLAPAHDPDDKVLGIIGYGGIGGCLAERCRLAYNMKVIYYNPKRRADAPEWAEYKSQEELLAEADVVSLHMPLRRETKGIFGAKQFAQMKKGAILVNTARGGVLDEEAMIASLKSGHLAGAGLDVFPDEPKINPALLEIPTVTVLPHMGTETEETQKKMEVRVMMNLKNALETGEITDRVA